jgi:GNAT superfamily N-acetyltransferase
VKLPKGCTLVAVGEEGDEDLLDELGLDLWEAADDADALFRQMHIRPSSIEELKLAAVCDGEVVGAATLGVEQDDVGPLYTFSVVVDPDWRRKGLARALIEDVIELAAEDAEARGEGLAFRVWVVNPHMAKLLEEHFDFEPYDTTEWSLDTPHMQRWG